MKKSEIMDWLKNNLMPAKAAEKEVAMSDPVTQATPPAASGGLTKADLEALLNPLVKQVADLTASNKALQEAVKTVPTQESIGKVVTDTLATRDTTAAQAKARDAFVAEQLKNVPAAYAATLGNDPAKWGDEAKGIRETLTKDLAAMGVKTPPVTTNAPAAGATTADGIVDMSKLTGAQLIGLAVKQSAASPIARGPAVGSAGAESGSPVVTAHASK